ncbi:MAG: alpha/beta hydrolase family esterase [Iamia sp.]
MTRRSTPRSVAAVLATAALLVGCSSDAEDADAASPNPVATSVAAETPTPAEEDTTPTGSAGCDAASAAPGRSVESVASGGTDRSYVRYVPTTDEDGPRPLVVDLTAYSPAALEERISGFTLPGADGTVKADEVGAVVVTPEPVGGAGELLTWNLTDQPGWADDDLFLADLLDQVAAETCLAPGHTLVMGFAIGGVMASRLACSLGEDVALLATVAGLDDPPGCDPARPVPVLALQGTADRFLPADGGVGTGAAGLPLSPKTTAGLVGVVTRRGPATETAAAWATRNGCGAEPADEEIAEGATRRAWTGCDDDAGVELVTIDGGEHTWPGSTTMDDLTGLLGPVSDAVVANDLIWDRFQAELG